MASTVIPSKEFRKELKNRGGDTANRCFQCATCSSVCELATGEIPFPRRQMLRAQWGLADQLATDPAVWLCHQCNDCTTRCPRDAKPGDVMQTVRSLTVENLAFPKFLGKLVGKAAYTWPLLLGLPIAFWIAVTFAMGAFDNISAPLAFHDFVPHWLIYAVFFPVSGFVVLAAFISGVKFWNALGKSGPARKGSFIGGLIGSLFDIATHKRFGSCDTAKPRRWGHFFLLWGFVGAALTTFLVILAMYVWKEPLPLPQSHPFKWIGNASAVFLVLGVLILVANRLTAENKVGRSTAFDNFFTVTVVFLVITGVMTEVGRLFFSPEVACWIYIMHLSSILTLFFTFPYSKFAHILYRTLAMVHERMTIK
jgi:quinone-modifying oxidoreductase subunit QmoC